MIDGGQNVCQKNLNFPVRLPPPFNDLIHRTPNEASSWQHLHCFEDARDKRKGKINFGAEKHVCWVENFSPAKIFAPAINLRQGEGKQSGFQKYRQDNWKNIKDPRAARGCVLSGANTTPPDRTQSSITLLYLFELFAAIIECHTLWVKLAW